MHVVLQVQGSIRAGARPFGSIVFEVLSDMTRTKDTVDVAAFIETLVGDELEFCRIFNANFLRDLALKEGRILAERLEDGFLVLTKKRLHEHRRVAKIGGHAYLRHTHEMGTKDIVMNFAPLEQLAEHMTHLLADPKQSDRPALGGFLATHQPLPLP